MHTHKHTHVEVAQLCLTLCDTLGYSPWNSPGQNTGVGSLSLLQGIFPTQQSNWVSCIAGRSTELSGKPIYIFTYISIFFPIMFVVVLVFRMVRDYCSTLMRVVTFMYAWAVPSCNCPGRVTLTRGLIRAPYLDPEWQSSFLSLT